MIPFRTNITLPSSGRGEERMYYEDEMTAILLWYNSVTWLSMNRQNWRKRSTDVLLLQMCGSIIHYYRKRKGKRGRMSNLIVLTLYFTSKS